jgi:glucan endo-1,3-alpha-glucosidase
VVFLSDPATVTMSCGSSKTETQQPYGVAKMKLALVDSGNVEVVVTRDGETVARLAPANMTFSTQQPAKYNFNAFVAGSESSAQSPGVSKRQEKMVMEAGAQAHTRMKRGHGSLHTF